MLSIEKQPATATIGYGTWNLKGNIEEIIEKAVLAGYRYFDCTDVYGNEKRLGKALKNVLSHPSKFHVNREDVLLTIDTRINIMRVARSFFHTLVLQDESRLCSSSS